MATAALVSIREYLHTRYRPDADYVDGAIEERNTGELDHGRMQGWLYSLLSASPAELHFECVPELRIRVSERRVRVPDLCLTRIDHAEEQVVETPPLLCIEILSPEDTIPRTMLRVRDFLTMGVPEVWIVDPARRTVHLCTLSATTLQTEGALQVPETPITLSIEEAFSILDKKRRP